MTRKGQSHYDAEIEKLTALLECGRLSPAEYERACAEAEDRDLQRSGQRSRKARREAT